MRYTGMVGIGMGNAVSIPVSIGFAFSRAGASVDSCTKGLGTL